MPPIMIPEFPKGRSISYREKQDSEFLWRGTVTSAKRVKDRDYFVYTVQLLTKNIPGQGWVPIPTEMRNASDYQLQKVD